MNWISCADKMPDPGLPVIAYSREKNFYHARFVDRNSVECSEYADYSDYNENIDTYFWPCGWYECGIEITCLIEDEITHWMLLPPPPGGE